jgi:hypothetical protein
MDTDVVERADSTVSTTVLTSIAGTPFKGVIHKYSWQHLEPSKNNYNFAKIREHRNALAGIGKRLIVQIQDKTFSGDTLSSTILPRYLTDGSDSAYQGGWAPRGNDTGIAPKFWVPAVMDRHIALIQALAAEFDDDPWIEGFVVGESALFNVAPPGYSHSTIAPQMHRLADAASAAFKSTNIFVMTNFFFGLSNTSAFIDYLQARKIGVGGPDVRPDNVVDGSEVISGQHDGIVRSNRTPIFFQNQWRSLDGSWTLAELHDYAHNVNRQHYVSWVRKEATGGLSYSRDVLPWIRTNNPPSRTACPENYRNACLTD